MNVSPLVLGSNTVVLVVVVVSLDLGLLISFCRHKGKCVSGAVSIPLTKGQTQLDDDCDPQISAGILTLEETDFQARNATTNSQHDDTSLWIIR